jgi:intraflagellar transport protein 172
VNQAIPHFIEAGQYTRAIEAALESKQWNKAVSIVDNLDTETGKKYYKQIARHYEETLNYDLAEKYYVKGGWPEESVEMYTKVNLWDRAHAIAVTYMSEKEVTLLYMSQAQKLEQALKFKEAEKLYITVGEHDQAINMYKKAHKYDDLIRLVTTYHKDRLKETHLHLAQQLEAEGQFKQAERHYIDGGDWKSAVNMYRVNEMWEEALRVAKQYGGSNAYVQVAVLWARAIGGESGLNLLIKFGLVEAAVDLAVDIRMFKKAEEICRSSLKRKLVDVYLKHAMVLEDEGQLSEAEAEFIKAGSPKDAIDMYVHQQDWLNAMRVAEAFDPASITDIMEAQARIAIQNKDYARAETCFIAAKKPEEAIKMYKELNMWSDVMRVTSEHMSDKMVDFDEQIGRQMDAIQRWINVGDYGKAIDALLKKTTENTTDLDELEESWENAVKLAMNHLPERITEVTRIVSKRLVDIKRYQQAAELLAGIDAVKESIDVYIQGGLWEQARSIAASRAPDLSTGVTEAKLNVLVERGEWDQVLELATQQGITILGLYRFISNY